MTFVLFSTTPLARRRRHQLKNIVLNATLAEQLATACNLSGGNKVVWMLIVALGPKPGTAICGPPVPSW
jgi:hypothetical protein